MLPAMSSESIQSPPFGLVRGLQTEKVFRLITGTKARRRAKRNTVEYDYVGVANVNIAVTGFTLHSRPLFGYGCEFRAEFMQAPQHERVFDLRAGFVGNGARDVGVSKGVHDEMRSRRVEFATVALRAIVL